MAYTSLGEAEQLVCSQYGPGESGIRLRPAPKSLYCPLGPVKVYVTKKVAQPQTNCNTKYSCGFELRRYCLVTY